jgi:hypothetical protein
MSTPTNCRLSYFAILDHNRTFTFDILALLRFMNGIFKMRFVNGLFANQLTFSSHLLPRNDSLLQIESCQTKTGCHSIFAGKTHIEAVKTGDPGSRAIHRIWAAPLNLPTWHFASQA